MLVLIWVFIFPSVVEARKGDSGYEGGISSGEEPGKTSFAYQEVIFISGKPIVLEGSLTLRKTLRRDTRTGTDTLTSIYTYNLSNLDENANLTRALTLITKQTKKDNGQTIEETTLNPNVSESITIDGKVYTLTGYDFSQTSITDPKSAVEYFSGNIWGKKKYSINGGNGNITIDVTGDFFGYKNHWGRTETQILNYFIQAEEEINGEKDEWGGRGSIKTSSSTRDQIKYVEHEPQVISFQGGYINAQFNKSVLEYESKLPVFDQNGLSTNMIQEKRGSIKIETFPKSSRLPIHQLDHLRGHWAEPAVGTLFSLEILKGDSANFNPEKIMNRAEFAQAIVLAAKEVPPDPLRNNQTTNIGRTTQKPVSPFLDVSVDNSYFPYIHEAYQRGLLMGKGDNRFAPNDHLMMADAITVLMNALGLSNMASRIGVQTTFKDDLDIPAYAKNSIIVAQKIGLVKGDTNGYLKPMERMTQDRAAVMINNFLNYMREGMIQDYRERIIHF
jgi:N-acetylmuramoyl-L-alanine amidase